KWRHSGRRAAAAAACRHASDTATVAFAPSRDLSGVPSSAISFWSTACWSRASTPSSALRISVLTFRTALATSIPPSASPPSRRSFASYEPVDAPAGAIARPRAPLRTTSASTVGRPRESQTRRPRTSTILAIVRGPSRGAAAETKEALAPHAARAPFVLPAADTRLAIFHRCAQAADRGGGKQHALPALLCSPSPRRQDKPEQARRSKRDRRLALPGPTRPS